ncbi:hypothetical protein CDV55_107738 [Aspergillus turcosus]|nr:hypothetical protein CDV55_107738 [Aspergillus turcosus]
MDIIVVVASAARNGIPPLLFQPCLHAYLSHTAMLSECGELAGSSCSLSPAVLPHDDACSSLRSGHTRQETPKSNQAGNNAQAAKISRSWRWVPGSPAQPIIPARGKELVTYSPLGLAVFLGFHRPRGAHVDGVPLLSEVVCVIGPGTLAHRPWNSAKILD